MKIRAVTKHNLAELYWKDFSDAEFLAVNYTGIISFNGSDMIPAALKLARDISDKNKNTVLLHGEVAVEDESFLSVFVFERGILRGVSDCISNRRFVHGNALRVYRLEKLKLGVSVDSDLFHAGIHNLAYQGADMIVSITKREFDKLSLAAIRCQKRLSVCPFVFVFGDTIISFEGGMQAADSDGVLEISPSSCQSGYRGFLRVTTEN